MAKYDAKAQLAEQKKKSQDIEDMLETSPLEEGIYLVRINSYKTTNGLTVNYQLTAEDEFTEETPSFTVREFYSTDNIPMFQDKQRDITYLFNLANDDPITTSHHLRDLVGFVFAAELVNNKKDGKSFWRVQPIIPEETE